MLPPGHAAGGFLATKVFLKLRAGHYDPNKLGLFTVLGTLAAVLPDCDGIIHYLRLRRATWGAPFRHHTWVSHTFPPYWMIGLGIYLWGKLRHNSTAETAGEVFGLGTTVHLLSDMLGPGDGIMLLYPASRQMFGVLLWNLHEVDWIRAYRRHPSARIEFVLIAAALWLALFTHKRESKRT